MAEQLTALCEWLADHRTNCLRRVEMWMLRSLPVPCDVVRAVSPHPDWSEMLRNLVVTPADAQGKTNAAQTGLLRDADPKKGIGGNSGSFRMTPNPTMFPFPSVTGPEKKWFSRKPSARG